MIDQALFSQFLALVESIAGMAPPVSHQNHIRRELLKLQTRWAMDTRDLLKAVCSRDDIRQEFLNSVTINETYFFREQRHFDFLRSTVLPQLTGLDRRVQFWSVSCSTGEEAVSLAVLAADHVARSADAPGMRFVVHASDINAEVLSRFRSGRFSLRSFRADGSDYHDLLHAYGTVHGDAAAGSFELNTAALNNIHIFEGNVCGKGFLAAQDDHLPELVDVLFFRNTLLYMAMDKRPQIIDNLVQRMSPGGWMFLSSAEVPFIEHKDLEIVEHCGLYCFRKRQPAAMRSGAATHSPAPIKPARPAEPVEQSASPPAAQDCCLHEQIAAVLEAIHTGRIEEAESWLENLAAAGLATCIEGFLLGQLYRAQEQNSAAAVQFARSFARNSGFWPGRFYFALSIKASDPQTALQEFRTVASRTAGARQGCEKEYAFLLDGFDPGLFGQIAQDWIRKLEAAEAVVQGGTGGITKRSIYRELS